MKARKCREVFAHRNHANHDLAVLAIHDDDVRDDVVDLGTIDVTHDTFLRCVFRAVRERLQRWRLKLSRTDRWGSGGVACEASTNLLRLALHPVGGANRSKASLRPI